MDVDGFEDFGACRIPLRQFLAADADLDALVRDIIVPDPTKYASTHKSNLVSWTVLSICLNIRLTGDNGET